MKKILLLISLCLLASTFNVAAKSKKKKKNKADIVTMNTEADSVSYAFGVAIGANFKGQLSASMNEKENLDLFLNGFSTAMKGDSTILSPQFSDTYIQNYMMKTQIERDAEHVAKNQQFLEENAKKPGVFKTESGLQYQVISEGSGAMPSETDKVKVHYHGTLIDGTVFDSSVERGEPIEFALNQVIQGWTEGVQLMSIGAKYKLFIPADLGYGPQPVGPIAPNSTLIFEVELLDIIK